jgi:hypothetical protein
MNIDTGHLISGEKMEELISMGNKRKEKFLKSLGYQHVPKELEPAAKKKLAGKDEAYISLTSGGKLSKWAAGERKKRKKAEVKKNKNKRKMAKASRKKNRGGQ